MDAVTSATASTASVANSEKSKAVISSDFDTFLKMLTAQMQNQDPLNPIDSTDYAVQLATFSNVEQQVRTNELLETLGGQMGIMGMAQLSGWVGMEARSASPAHFDGSPISLTIDAEPSSDAAVLVVSNSAGNEVQRLDVLPGDKDISWAGVDANGNAMPSGSYSFSLESYAYDEMIGTSAVESYARVLEARNDNGNVTLLLDGGAEVDSAAVTALRSPD